MDYDRSLMINEIKQKNKAKIFFGSWKKPVPGTGLFAYVIPEKAELTPQTLATS